MHSTTPTPPDSNWPLSAALALLLPALLMAGCATPPAPLQPKPVRAVQLPPLGPPPQKPSICLPDCLTAWQAEQQRLLSTLIPRRTTPNTAEPPTTAPEKR